MTPFQVYLLMQADSICVTMGLLAILSGITFLITTLCRYITYTDVKDIDIENQSSDWRLWKACVKMHIWSMWIFFPSLFISILMPNTKTIATMVVLPKITSPAALNAMGEKGEQLYNIATQALQGMVDKNKQPDEKKAP